ncbi:MAG: hypothetical protein ACFB4I_17540 [Cyanophyceae cyanobacterium]
MSLQEFIGLLCVIVPGVFWFATIEVRLRTMQLGLTEYLRAQRMNDGKHDRTLIKHHARLDQLENFLEKHHEYRIRHD